jgi:hypothetical protein
MLHGDAPTDTVDTLVCCWFLFPSAGNTWKPVFLGDLVMADRVKFHYRKAMLILHPDKNVNGSVEQRFVAEKVGLGWSLPALPQVCGIQELFFSPYESLCNWA